MITRATTRRQFLHDVQTVPEPVGIVIADGGPAATAPRFLAYVWGAAPPDVTDEAAASSGEFRALTAS
ncbi:MAG: hypothetical protein MUE41_12930 [Gemmatimonadaceae bacterium]|nr:hypothetical protein [Gemmatimonadaceae bacterium]